MSLPDRSTPQWISVSLVLSSIHSISWGLFIIGMPLTASRVSGFDTPPREIFLWRGVGLVIVLFGIGYAIAAMDPFRHWAVVLICLLAKVIGPIGMFIAVARDEFSPGILRRLPVNDMIWWIPLLTVSSSGIPRCSPQESDFPLRVARESGSVASAKRQGSVLPNRQKAARQTAWQSIPRPSECL